FIWYNTRLIINYIVYFFFFFSITSSTELYTLSLHDALPIWLTSGSVTASATSCDETAVSSSKTLLKPCELGEILGVPGYGSTARSEEHTSELQSQSNLVCRLLLEKKKNG